MKALVVEDDRKVARLLARVLQEEGYVVDTCATGSDAEHQAGAIDYDVVVLDWMLPEGDGLGLGRALRPRFEPRRGAREPHSRQVRRRRVAHRDRARPGLSAAVGARRVTGDVAEPHGRRRDGAHDPRRG